MEIFPRQLPDHDSLDPVFPAGVRMTRSTPLLSSTAVCSILTGVFVPSATIAAMRLQTGQPTMVQHFGDAARTARQPGMSR